LTIRHVTEDLECDRSLAGEQPITQTWVDERCTPFCGERFCGIHRRVVIRLRGIDRRAERSDAVALDLWRVLGHEDRGRHAEVLGRIGHAQAMIARRGRDDTPLSLVGRQQREHIERAA
jgi:hypothetical protein